MQVKFLQSSTERDSSPKDENSVIIYYKYFEECW